MFDYESPITQILREMQTEYENGVLKAVQSVGFHVNKEELTKALLYDRGQYDKGYAAGLNADRWIPCSERLPEESLNSVIGWDEYRERCCFVQYLQGRWVLGNDIDIVKITAWQPTPAPYQRGESDSE